MGRKSRLYFVSLIQLKTGSTQLCFQLVFSPPSLKPSLQKKSIRLFLFIGHAFSFPHRGAVDEYGWLCALFEQGHLREMRLIWAAASATIIVDGQIESN
jgi:hypothetical protein